MIHDLDYERYPEEHCVKGEEILTERGGRRVYSCRAESWLGICSEVEPVHRMEKVLYTIDELTGLITAAALVRPSKSLLTWRLNQ